MSEPAEDSTSVGSSKKGKGNDDHAVFLRDADSEASASLISLHEEDTETTPLLADAISATARDPTLNPGTLTDEEGMLSILFRLVMPVTDAHWLEIPLAAWDVTSASSAVRCLC